MKKIISLLLILLCCLAVVACVAVLNAPSGNSSYSKSSAVKPVPNGSDSEVVIEPKTLSAPQYFFYDQHVALTTAFNVEDFEEYENLALCYFVVRNGAGSYYYTRNYYSSWRGATADYIFGSEYKDAQIICYDFEYTPSTTYYVRASVCEIEPKVNFDIDDYSSFRVLARFESEMISFRTAPSDYAGYQSGVIESFETLGVNDEHVYFGTMGVGFDYFGDSDSYYYCNVYVGYDYEIGSTPYDFFVGFDYVYNGHKHTLYADPEESRVLSNINSFVYDFYSTNSEHANSYFTSILINPIDIDSILYVTPFICLVHKGYYYSSNSSDFEVIETIYGATCLFGFDNAYEFTQINDCGDTWYDVFGEEKFVLYYLPNSDDFLSDLPTVYYGHCPSIAETMVCIEIKYESNDQTYTAYRYLSAEDISHSDDMYFSDVPTILANDAVYEQLCSTSRILSVRVLTNRIPYLIVGVG